MDIDKSSYLWKYISDPQKDLLLQGQYLMDHVIAEGKYSFTDYSFIVFPFAKGYEGFLKQLFLDAGFISRVDYISDHFRLGKVLSPNLTRKLGERSVYTQLIRHSGQQIADKIWETWKLGRNQVFHYFPHNIRSLSFQEAQAIISQIMQTMEQAVVVVKTQTVKNRLRKFTK